MMKDLRVTVLSGAYAVCRLPAEAPIPEWVGVSRRAELISITRTSEELSILLPEEHVPVDVQCERGLRAIKLLGPLPFETVGILAGLAHALASSGIAIFAVSTYDTDYILVKASDLASALEALGRGGCEIVELRASR